METFKSVITMDKTGHKFITMPNDILLIHEAVIDVEWMEEVEESYKIVTGWTDINKFNYRDIEVLPQDITREEAYMWFKSYKHS